MKQCLITIAGVLGSMCAFVALLMAIGTAIGKPPQETVLTLSAGETQPYAVTEELRFPFAIPDTTLTANSLCLYEGEMLETDNGEYLVDAAALEVKNHGDREVAVAYIVLEMGNAQYHFYGTNLPANSTALLTEMDGRAYSADGCMGCTAWVKYGASSQELDTGIIVSEIGDKTLRVENISEKPVEDIVLYYKNYIPEENLYLGGITYQIYVGTLLPGQSIEISPFRYVSGYSKIIKAVPH